MLSPRDLKARYNRTHAMDRALSRYELTLTPDKLLVLEERIRHPDDNCRLLRPDHRGANRNLYALKLDGQWLPVIFDHATDSLMSFLPPDALDPYLSTIEPLATPVEQAPLLVAPRRLKANVPGEQRAPLSSAEAGKIMDAIPELPPMPSRAATDEEMRVFKAAITARQLGIQDAFTQVGFSPDSGNTVRGSLVAEVNKLAAVREEFRKVSHAVFTRSLAAACDVVEPHDAIALMKAARSVLRAFAKRLDGALEPGEQAVITLLEEYIRNHHGPARPLSEKVHPGTAPDASHLQTE